MPLHPLQRGGTVALIAPSGPLKSIDDVDRAIWRLKERGYRVKLMPSAGSRYGYLSGVDELRAEGINKAFADDSVNAVFCLRGGYGAARILDRIDYDMIRSHPKIFCGYSDITALHTVFSERCAFPTFHATMPGASVYDPADLFEMVSGGSLPEFHGLTCLNPGTASGKLTGGNLSLLAGLLGTPYEIDTRGKILFIEDVGELPYRLDAMLTHLRLAGKFRDCAGVIFGQFTRCEAPEPQYSLSIRDILRDVVAPCGKPIVTGLYCGHVDNSVSLPLGVRCVLDAENGAVSFPEKIFPEL